ncbi:MAG: transcription elongation factor GreA [Candidatus Nealsonbacteria bacterium]|nr:MAG: transcription elongation factor GreA [Candidatus Nealsonbacteria bacterium]
MPQKYLTPQGMKKLKEELAYLKDVKRREIMERLEKSLAFGDLTENAEYHEAKEAQAFVEGRILELEDLINNAVVTFPKKNGNLAQVGSTVLVSSGALKREKLKIVGAEEADPVEGKISVDSPLGKALLEQPEGVVVEVETPQGRKKYKILKIE